MLHTIDFSAISNNAYMSQISLKLLSEIDHPIWNEAGFYLHDWQSRCSEYSIAAVATESECIAKKILHLSDPYLSSSRGPDTESRARLRASLMHHLQTTHLLNLKPLFSGKSFAFYVVTQFIQHLRVSLNTEFSFESLQQLIQPVISGHKSALPVVVGLMNCWFAFGRAFDKFESTLRAIAWRALDVHSPVFSLEKYETLANTSQRYTLDIESISVLQNGTMVFAPLSFLTLINIRSKALFQRAFATTISGSIVANWEKYLVNLLFMVCRYNSAAAAETLLDPTTFSTSSAIFTRSMFRAQDRSGLTPVHRAIKTHALETMKVLVRVDDHNIFQSNIERLSIDDEARTPEPGFAPLLYTPDWSGQLPVHHAASSRIDPAILDWIIQYDAELATLCPSSSLDLSESVSQQKQISMMDFKDQSGYLPIHRAADDVFKTEAILRYKTDTADQSHHHSRLLYARTNDGELPIDIVLSP